MRLPASRVSGTPVPQAAGDLASAAQPAERWFMSPAKEGQGPCVPSWSRGGAGCGDATGMWQAGGRSWLPGAWYAGRRLFMSIKRAFSSGGQPRPEAAHGGGQGPTQTASRERGLCGERAAAAGLEGGGQRCTARGGGRQVLLPACLVRGAGRGGSPEPSSLLLLLFKSFFC